MKIEYLEIEFIQVKRIMFFFWSLKNKLLIL